MSGISTGIGLISGIDIAGTIEALMQLERRPVTTLQQRVDAIDAQRTAFMAISAQLLAAKNSVLNMNSLSFFRRFSSTSSDDTVMTARAEESAVPGSHTFRVRSLVSSHSLISRGFADAGATPVGTGTLAIEIGHGQVNASTRLDALNGGDGIRRGVFTITDRDGNSADIDTRMAISVDDVLDAINSSASINVRASVSGLTATGSGFDRIIIEDLTVGTGNLVITDKDGGSAAADLGIAGTSATERIEGSDLVRLSGGTLLSTLNDGNGVGRLGAGTANDLTFRTTNGDFDVSLTGILASQEDTDLRALNGGNGVRLGTLRITDRAGNSVDIDLADPNQPPVNTVREVRERILAETTAAGMDIHVTLVNSHFLIRDESTVADAIAQPFKIEDVGGHAAADLGIAQEVEEGAIHGQEIYRVETLGDVIRAINYAPGNGATLVHATVSADGNGIMLQARGIGNSVTVEAAEGSTAALDLGIMDAAFSTGDPFVSRHLVAGLNSVLLQTLNGGAGMTPGQFTLRDRSGAATAAPLDFARASTLQDVVDIINENTETGIVASINGAGNGLALRDTSVGTDPMVVTDAAGSDMAAQLGIAGAHDLIDGASVNGGSLQLQYVSERTLLSELNAGQGIESGRFQITDSAGAAYQVNLADRNVETVGDVIQAINSSTATSETLQARINDTGDGILITDTSGGEGSLSIEDLDGRAARSLHLAGTAGAGQNQIDGSFEIRIDINAGDTLDDIVAKINEAGAPVAASVVNDGGPTNPYSLTLASTVTGSAGQLVIDTQGLDLGLSTLSEASDAIVTVGGEGGTTPILITSSTNTLDSVIEGVTLDLLSVSEDPVTVSVAQDVDAIVDALTDFVGRYNDVQQSLDDVTRFDQETLERGVLQGDRTIQQIRSRMRGAVSRQVEGVTESFSRMFSVGLRLGANNRLEFDAEKFREAYAESPELVEDLFATEETGFGTMIDEALDALTREFDGLITRRDDLLSEQQELLNDRIDSLNILLEGKQGQLEAQFIAMERALAGLQGQQSALSTLAQMASGA